ncbi:hypothetical protein PHYSODRAFT_257039 [Phytophthora sojae]|uniref:Myb-like domain-containing protein n=1 Tax=Phytophthora sojae (strain P6497) TaxID=1094619 RepID=G4YUJ0_PHYSP|nr:hypothetical protein PHYSODRAFT_257039 [Phytophthora sojae]EGZ24882.1 hypothetical protein PHYSODRAFT_257039 [Phytophthora sojae]|eukprot:XP_009520170.1 hypothetical protein PHYSODRAFT_257039 [Phytophthora sojae]
MISPEVMQELLSVRQVLHYLPESASTEKGWSEHEQHLFWVALAQHPQGPWTTIAEFIGTKSARQAMTHGQKLRQKLKRWNERLRSNPTASMLMDGVDVSTSANVAVTAGISVEAMPTTTEAAMISTDCSGFQSGFPVDGVNIVEMNGLHVTDANIMGSSCVAGSSIDTTQQFTVGAPSQYAHASAAHPTLSEDTARVVGLMLSESSEEVQLTDISDDPEILPQHLLDDLLEILSDDDLNELSHHH